MKLEACLQLLLKAHVLQMSPWTIWVEVMLNTSCFLLHCHHVSRCLPQRFKSGLPKCSGAEYNPCYATYCSIRAGMFKISKHHMRQQSEKQENIFLFLQFLLSRRLFFCSESVPETPNRPVCHVTNSCPIVLLLNPYFVDFVLIH